MSKEIEAMKEAGWELANGTLDLNTHDFLGFVRPKANAIVDFERLIEGFRELTKGNALGGQALIDGAIKKV